MTGNRYEVLILGRGEIGRAIEHVVGARHAVRTWERGPKPGGPAVVLQEAAERADFVVFCLPTAPHFELATRIRRHLAPHAICLSVSKGLDDRGRNAAEALRDALPEHATGVLCGPMIAEEIVRNRPGFAQFSMQHHDAFSHVELLFAGSLLHIETGGDPVATSWAAVLKNIYAIVFGVADGLSLGDNVRGYLAVAASREMGRIIAHLTGREPAPYQLAGLGDMVTTATSAGSRHHEIGFRVARGERGPVSGEGVHSVEMLQRLRMLPDGAFSLFDLVASLLAERDNVRQRFLRYLSDSRC